jgi:hypothetical protein
VWPLLTKKSIQRLVISCDFMSCVLTLLGSRILARDSLIQMAVPPWQRPLV